ncbi:MAG TPA: type II toxin-antitoxin system HipA family toxin [Acidimicrobiales bacterium]|nr:type II toxin-antitoxin system HipA family toxin [Acidimicrobiales bacterium]
MTSEAYVWVWLPGEREPVVAGVLRQRGPVIAFSYAQSYLNNETFPLYLPELPFGSREIAPEHDEVAGCIRDAGPDAWGRRVVRHQLQIDPRADEPGLLDYLLHSGSNRVGALDFQASPTEYVHRGPTGVTLEDLMRVADAVEVGAELAPELRAALLLESSPGGAYPKALIEDGNRYLLAKFSSPSEDRPVLQYEYVAMTLARRAGLNVAPVELVRVLDRDVLLVERFDRDAGGRRAVVSALTVLGLGEMEGRYASYADLAEQIRARFTEPRSTLRELFGRITFNILVSNTDDHAKNHAAFWDGSMLTLTPAYDVTPQRRSGGEATQAMAIGEDGWKMAQVAGCIERASTYLLDRSEAREIVDRQIAVIDEGWDDVAEACGMSDVERRRARGRQILNPYALEGV